MNRSRRWSSLLALTAAAAALATFPTCSSTKHTVARIVTPAARPAEVFVPEPVAPPPPPPPPAATRAPQVSPARRSPPPSPTPSVAPMRVVTAPAAPAEQSPGVLYEQMVPTAVPATPMSPTAIPPTPFRPTPTIAAPPTETRVPTPRSRREVRDTPTPKPGSAPKPGVYYEDEQGRPLPTPTPG
jgi:hypothetical protein